MHVMFFDIDGTLINTRGSGLTALKTAFVEVFARPAPEQIETTGRTDRGIAGDLFRTHGIEDTADHWQAFHEAYLRQLVIELPRRDGCVLPGVAALLEELTLRRDVAVGLLTGNTTAGARLKLDHFGIGHHFAFGGFGERYQERNAVAREALAAAQRYVAGPVHTERVWVVGDTPLDIRCARHIGAQAVAVATGWHDREALARETPDLLFDDLTQADALRERLTGN
jgi:phosphoglycolate phosphatase